MAFTKRKARGERARATGAVAGAVALRRVSPRPFQCKADAIRVRFEAHRLNRALELAGDPHSALPSREDPQQFQISSAPDNSLAARAWHVWLPDTKEPTLYMLQFNKASAATGRSPQDFRASTTISRA